MPVSSVLDSVIRPLNDVLFAIGSDQVTWAELLGFLTGGACVWLTVRASVLNFPVGLANSAFFLVLFAYAQLWADAWLQVLYIALGAVGWWQWAVRRPGAGARPIRAASGRMLAGCVVFVVAATAVLYPILRGAEDAAPFWDALTTALSLAAQWLLNLRRVQTWWFWIAADLVYVPLYVAKDLELTAVVYVLFLGLCFAGLRQWQRLRHPAPSVAEAVAA